MVDPHVKQRFDSPFDSVSCFPGLKNVLPSTSHFQLCRTFGKSKFNFPLSGHEMARAGGM